MITAIEMGKGSEEEWGFVLGHAHYKEEGNLFVSFID